MVIRATFLSIELRFVNLKHLTIHILTTFALEVHLKPLQTMKCTKVH